MAMKRIHVARLPDVFFLLGRELGGGLGEEQKGARSPALFSCHASPQSPVHNGKIAAAGPGKERRRQGTWLECMHSPKYIACTTGQ